MTGPAVCFRCDAGPGVGLGHLVRSLSLASALRELGARCLFLVRGEGAAGRVAEAGFPCTLAPGPAGEALGAEDLEALDAAARGFGARAAVVDHYGAGHEYFWAAAGMVDLLGIIDDTGERDLTAAGWVLNQNLGKDRLALRVRPGAEVLLGPHHALLRPQFGRERARFIRRFSPGDRRVLVTLGGGEATRELAAVLEGLEEVRDPLEVRVLATRVDPLPRSRHRVTAVASPPGVAPHMAWADLSAGASGSTCWELACLGVPMIVTPLSRDQEGIAEALGAAGCARVLQPPGFSGLTEAVEGLLASPEERRRMSQAASGLVDGLGAERSARSLLETLGEGAP